jgi:hypothetical protein
MLLAPAAKTKRSLELVQLLLTCASFCTVLAASGLAAPADQRPGYHAAAPLERDAGRDRRFSDLARFERKRREAEQQASRRGLARGLAARAKAAEEPSLPLTLLLTPPGTPRLAFQHCARTVKSMPTKRATSTASTSRRPIPTTTER